MREGRRWATEHNEKWFWKISLFKIMILWV